MLIAPALCHCCVSLLLPLEQTLDLRGNPVVDLGASPGAFNATTALAVLRLGGCQLALLGGAMRAHGQRTPACFSIAHE